MARTAGPLDYLFLLRPPLLVPVWTVFLLGYGRTGTLISRDPRLWSGLVALTLAFGAAFVLNQRYDVESDRLNQKCLFLPSGLISPSAALRYYWALVVLSLSTVVWAAWASSFVFLLLLLGVLYSAPPWRWKNRPYLALALNAVSHGLLVFQMGRMAAHASASQALLASWPYGLGVAAVYLLTTIPDREGDIVTGKRTVAVTLGPLRTARWAAGWYLAAVLLAIYTVDILFVFAVLPAVPWFVQLGRGQLRWLASAIRWPLVGLSLAASFLHPWYALVLAFGFWGTRAYYHQRWGVAYP